MASFASRPSSRPFLKLEPSTPLQMKINKKLDFDSCSEEDIPRSSSPDRGDLRKKLIFDDSDEDSPVKSNLKIGRGLVHIGLSPITKSTSEVPLLELRDFNSSGIESSVSTTDKFSPCRTRSGKIYTSVEKRRNNNNNNTNDNNVSTTSTSSVVTKSAVKSHININDSCSDSIKKLPTPTFKENPRSSSSRHCSGASAGIATPQCTRIQTSHLRVQELQLNLLQKDLSNEMMMELDEPTCTEPPPLNYSKRPMSRLLHISVDSTQQNTPKQHFDLSRNDAEDIKSPWLLQTPSNLHSPPTNEVKAMRLFDKSPTLGSSPVAAFTVPKFGATKSRLLFGAGDAEGHFNPRRASAPVGLRVSFGLPDVSQVETSGKERKRKRVANINPFTPTSMLASLKKKYQSEPVM